MRIAVVGGSLGGLFAAALLQAAGHEVRVYERSRSGLDGRGAGLVAQREVFAILRAVGCEHVAHVGVVAKERITLDRSGEVAERIQTPQMQISWDLLYRTFHERVAEGGYHLGRGVAAVGEDAEGAWLVLDDGARIEVDLIVGADGVGSMVRHAVVGSEAAPRYAGYVAWRGLFPETDLPSAAGEVLLDRFAFYHFERSHILGYLVAGPGGETDPGLRRYNWVWYRRVDDLPALLTDRSGKTHPFSLAPGGVPQAAIDAMTADARALLPPPFVAAVAAEPQPFIQAIFDYEAPSLVKGRLVLLGDAGFVVRPHTAMGVSKAAGDALALRYALEHAPDLGQALALYADDRLRVGREIAAYGRRLGASFL